MRNTRLRNTRLRKTSKLFCFYIKNKMLRAILHFQKSRSYPKSRKRLAKLIRHYQRSRSYRKARDVTIIGIDDPVDDGLVVDH